jgi:adenylate kinase family enzyme
MLPLESLGNRIVIFGPSNSGKSTLASALSQRLGIPATTSIIFVTCHTRTGRNALTRSSLRCMMR